MHANIQSVMKLCSFPPKSEWLRVKKHRADSQTSCTLHWQLENDPPNFPFFPSLLPQFVCISHSSPLLRCFTLRNKAAPPLSLTEHPLSLPCRYYWHSYLRQQQFPCALSPLQAARTHTLFYSQPAAAGTGTHSHTHSYTRLCWSSRRTGSYALI